MASSPTIALRIPPKLLEQLDKIAIERYPARNGGPNRSKMILYFIEKGLEELSNSHGNRSDNSQAVSHNDMSYNSNTISHTQLGGIEELIKQQVAQQVQIQLHIQQEVRQQLGQTSKIAELGQEVAELKKF